MSSVTAPNQKQKSLTLDVSTRFIDYTALNSTAGGDRMAGSVKGGNQHGFSRFNFLKGMKECDLIRLLNKKKIIIICINIVGRGGCAVSALRFIRIFQLKRVLRAVRRDKTEMYA